MSTNLEVNKEGSGEEIVKKVEELGSKGQEGKKGDDSKVEKDKEEAKDKAEKIGLEEKNIQEEKEEEKKQELKEESTLLKEENLPVQNAQNELQNEEEGEDEGEQGEDEANWTDATQSVAADEDIDVWVVDDDIVNEMQIDSGEEEIGQQDEKEGEKQEKKQEQEENKEGQKKMQENEFDLKQLQNQFVKGGQSEQDWRLGFHTQFCIAVAIAQDRKSVFSGGGDDRLLCFHEVEGKWQKFYELKHNQTVSKVQLSHDGKYVVTLTDEQIYCTEIAKLQSRKLEVEQPVDVICHKQGGVLVAAHGFAVSIFNLKGLDLYTSYNLDLPPSSIGFSENGKQIVAACENKIRIISPKTGEILKVSGNQFHKEQISTFATAGPIILSGSIDGDVFVSGLAKANILGRFQPFKGSINCLTFTDNLALIAPEGDGLYWVDANKFKKIFHSPSDISVSSIVKVHSSYHYAIADLKGMIYMVDSRAPMNIIATMKAGNTVHALQSNGSQLYAACQDGYVRVFDTAKYL